MPMDGFFQRSTLNFSRPIIFFGWRNPSRFALAKQGQKLTLPVSASQGGRRDTISSNLGTFNSALRTP